MASKRHFLFAPAIAILGLIFSTCPALGADYLLKELPFPEAWAGDVKSMVKEFAPGGYSFYEFDVQGFTLMKDGAPAKGLEDLSLAAVIAAAEQAGIDAPTKEEPDGHGAYAALRNFVLEHSTGEIGRLRNFRTVMRLFQIKNDGDLARWRCFHGRYGSPFIGMVDCYLLIHREDGSAFYVMFGEVDMD